MLIFVLQSIWLYIAELAGKDLNIEVIIKFLIYVTPKLIPLVLPLTILLSSIMVFGSFAENYEFAAMKSTGISLQRAMSGLSIFIVGVAVITFFFANNAIPWSEMKFYNLRKNIAKTKPSMAIAVGQFNQIESTPYNIKVQNKSGDNDQFLEDVTIHLKAADGRTNAKTIKAKTGEFFFEEKSNVLQLILFDGNYYEDLLPKAIKSRNKKPFAKSTFKKYIINIDLSDLNNVDFDENSQTDKYSMLDVVGLDKTLDSLIVMRQKEVEGISKNLFNRSGFAIITQKTGIKPVNDSVYNGNVLDLFDTKKKSQLVDITLRSITSSKQILNQKVAPLKAQKVLFNRHIISFHEKFALSFACIILFFVGAPLGALIRKGGIGLPMVIAILLFLTYHFIGIFATNSAKNGEFNPVLASWFSTLIMLPLGIYLTKRATADKGLFDIGSITEPLKKVFNIKEKDSVDYKFLASYKKEELLDIITNYKALGHDEPIRYEALNILKKKGHSISSLINSGLTINPNFDSSEKLALRYKSDSKIAIILYSIAVVLLILFFILKNNKLPSVATTSLKISLVVFFVFIVYYIKSIVTLFKFYKNIDKNEKRPNLIVLIITFPLYMFIYPFLSVKTKEDLKQNCLDSLK
tara:strand:- start:4784 stop:6688 length:1905 start_codon:yes stop_codon:yes gene_type:complete